MVELYVLCLLCFALRFLICCVLFCLFCLLVFRCALNMFLVFFVFSFVDVSRCGDVLERSQIEISTCTHGMARLKCLVVGSFFSLSRWVCSCMSVLCVRFFWSVHVSYRRFGFIYTCRDSRLEGACLFFAELA